jgi:hypothetical protein
MNSRLMSSSEATAALVAHVYPLPSRAQRLERQVRGAAVEESVNRNGLRQSAWPDSETRRRK